MAISRCTPQRFQPSLPLRGATFSLVPISSSCSIFQPSLPLRGATLRNASKNSPTLFQPSLPLRGATDAGSAVLSVTEFQPSLPLRGATRLESTDYNLTLDFNPRSPCGERPHSRPADPRPMRFQPSLPLRGATSVTSVASPRAEFQPSLPLRGATSRGRYRRCAASYFNPRSPCGERLLLALLACG